MRTLLKREKGWVLASIYTETATRDEAIRMLVIAGEETASVEIGR